MNTRCQRLPASGSLHKSSIHRIRLKFPINFSEIRTRNFFYRSFRELYPELPGNHIVSADSTIQDVARVSNPDCACRGAGHRYNKMDRHEL